MEKPPGWEAERFEGGSALADRMLVQEGLALIVAGCSGVADDFSVLMQERGVESDLLAGGKFDDRFRLAVLDDSADGVTGVAFTADFCKTHDVQLGLVVLPGIGIMQQGCYEVGDYSAAADSSFDSHRLSSAKHSASDTRPVRIASRRASNAAT